MLSSEKEIFIFFLFEKEKLKKGKETPEKNAFRAASSHQAPLYIKELPSTRRTVVHSQSYTDHFFVSSQPNTTSTKMKVVSV